MTRPIAQYLALRNFLASFTMWPIDDANIRLQEYNIYSWIDFQERIQEIAEQVLENART